MSSNNNQHTCSSGRTFIMIFMILFSLVVYPNFDRDAEEQAEKIASEIENQPAYKERADLENGDEEARFAAVERPRSDSPDEVKANTGKYVAPARRKNKQTGKLIRPALPLVSNKFQPRICQRRKC